MRTLMILWITLLLAACGGSAPSTEEVAQGFAALPPGNAENGAAIFARTEGAPPCGSCHVLEGAPINGPSLEGYGAVAETRVEGQSAEEYTYISIVNPGAYIVEGYANIMPAIYHERLSEAQIADLVAYLLTL